MENKKKPGSGKKKRSGKAFVLPAIKDMTEEERRLHINAEIVRTMPENIAEALAKARKKPVWCSDIRWRMELGRRARYRYLP